MAGDKRVSPCTANNGANTAAANRRRCRSGDLRTLTREDDLLVTEPSLGLTGPNSTPDKERRPILSDQVDVKSGRSDNIVSSDMTRDPLYGRIEFVFVTDYR